jgi:short-chain Z-isoprenyl diphosphate synthase
LIGWAVDHLAAQQRWPLRHIGDASVLPQHLRSCLANAENATRDINGMAVNMAVGYDGRREIATAVRRIAEDVVTGAVDVNSDELDWERLITDRLYTHGQDNPDLIIRTSGEQRLSGYLMWQSAWAELYFSPVLWPDFSHQDFNTALEEFSQRRRRYGT